MNAPRLQPLVPESLSSDQRVLYDTISGGARATGPQHFALKNDDGSLTGPFNAMLYAPTVGRALQDLGAAIRYGTGVTDRIREIAILLVAAHWDSAFERQSHEAVARAIGFAQDELDALRAGDLSQLDGDERVAADTVADLLRGDLSDAVWARARAVLGEQTVFELTSLVGYYGTLALQLRVFRVDS